MQVGPMFGNGESPRDNGGIIWGIAILAIGAGVTLITYFAAKGGGTYFALWGAVIFGFLGIIRGWMQASNGWRVVALISIAVIASSGWIVLQGDTFEDAKVGNCLDSEGLVVDCDGQQDYIVEEIFEFSELDSYPGQSYFDRRSENCPASSDSFFYPSQQTWDQSDRSLLCVRTE